MPSNLLIFDADYVSELTSRMNIACELMSEAVSSLKSASAHENWKCKERTRILGDFDELNVKLGRLDGGVNETTRILGGSVSRFAALESQYDSQAENLSDELTSNHGYAATVRTEGAGGQTVQPSSPSSQPGQTAQNTASGTSTETGAARQEAAASASADQESAGQGAAGTGGGGHGAAAASAVAGRVAGRGRHGQAEHGSPANSGGESQAAGGATMNVNVNLPVTHIPDNPEAAARGTKDTIAVAEAAVSMTVRTITMAFTGDAAPNAEELAEAYNAGRSIFENGAIIIGSPMQAHTTERLAMAAGIVSLAGNSSSGIGSAVSGVVGAASFSSSSSGGNIRTKAQNLMAAFQGNSQADELRNVLGIMAGSGSEGVAASSSGGSKSFFEMIVEELKKAISGENAGGSSSSLFSSSSSSSSSSMSSLSESSPVMEFLNNFVMDQV